MREWRNESEGKPLDAPVRSRMERAYRRDLSGVRVHTGGDAASVAREHSAWAVTAGEDIAFAAGRYRPGTLQGDLLVAHELAHVVQQSGAARDGAVEPVLHGGALETDADRSALSAVASGSAQPAGRSGLRLQACDGVPAVAEPAIGPTPDYDAFSSADGSMRDALACARMMRNPDQLDQVYADAAQGNARAQRFVRDLEQVFAGVGVQVAERVYSAQCSTPVVSELSGCVPNWGYLNFLRPERPGGARLLQVVGDAFEQRARQLHVRNDLIVAALNVLLAGVMVRGALRGTGAGPGRRPTGEAPPPPRTPETPARTPPAVPPQQSILVVGAETAEEFAYATQSAARGARVHVVNPRVTAAAEAYRRGGGNFYEGRIEDLPRAPTYGWIREDFPVPLAGFTPSRAFAIERLVRLLPGGRWVVVTESVEFARAVRAAAELEGASVLERSFTAAHETAPASVYPRESARTVLVIERH